MECENVYVWVSSGSLRTLIIIAGPSGMVRRTSSSKMYHMLTVEAPITKVIHILMAAKENSPLYIAQALDKVIEKSVIFR